MPKITEAKASRDARKLLRDGEVTPERRQRIAIAVLPIHATFCHRLRVANRNSGFSAPKDWIKYTAADSLETRRSADRLPKRMLSFFAFFARRRDRSNVSPSVQGAAWMAMTSVDAERLVKALSLSFL